MKESILKQCLDILKRDDIKKELKYIFAPIINLVLCELYPYIYAIVFLVFLIFIMILAILVILLFIVRNKHFFINPKI
jgi:hypothetical protein